MHLFTAACHEDVNSCFFLWFSKSTTSFYASGLVDHKLPLHFGLFCWNYALAGMGMLLFRPQWAETPCYKYFYTAFALELILLQAPLSFLADYCYMEDDSVVHVLDRGLAMIGMLLELMKVCLLWRHQRKGFFCHVYTLLCLWAIYNFGQSQHAQSIQDADGFIWYHNFWHTYPLLAFLWTGYDYYSYSWGKVSPPASMSLGADRRHNPIHTQQPPRLWSSVLLLTKATEKKAAKRL